MASGMTEAQAWDLMSAQIDITWQELELARLDGKVSDEVANADPHEVAGGCIWGMLKAHQTMTRLMEHQFKNDPAVAAALVRHLMSNSDAKTLKSLNGRVAVVEDKDRAHQSNLDSLKARVVALEKKK